MLAGLTSLSGRQIGLAHLVFKVCLAGGERVAKHRKHVSFDGHLGAWLDAAGLACLLRSMW